jgi:hypothetical protein
VRITSADQARAASALLRPTDLGAGWIGGQVKASSLAPPSCPGFNPKASDLVITGHANARYTFRQIVELDQDVRVLQSAEDVRTDFARSISPALGRCLAHQLSNDPRISSVSVTRIPFPPVGAVSAVYRAELGVKHHRGVGRAVCDYVYIGEGRMEFEFTVLAPAATGEQLTHFESSLAQTLLKRAARVQP